MVSQWGARVVCCVDRCQPKSVGGEDKLFVTDPWGQEFMVLQGGKAGDFPMSMGMSEVQLPVHAGELPSEHEHERGAAACARG